MLELRDNRKNGITQMSKPKPVLKKKAPVAPAEAPKLIASVDRAKQLLKQYTYRFKPENIDAIAQLCYDEQLCILEGIAKFNGKEYDPNKMKGVCRLDIF